MTFSFSMKKEKKFQFRTKLRYLEQGRSEESIQMSKALYMNIIYVEKIKIIENK